MHSLRHSRLPLRRKKKPFWRWVLLILLCIGGFLYATAVADEWTDTFDPPREYTLKQTIGVRSGPGNDHEYLGTLDKGAILRVDKIEKGWHRFKHTDGKYGYIFKRYLESMDGAPAEDDETADAKATPTPKPKKIKKEKPVQKAKKEAKKEAPKKSTPTPTPTPPIVEDTAPQAPAAPTPTPIPTPTPQLEPEDMAQMDDVEEPEEEENLAPVPEKINGELKRANCGRYKSVPFTPKGAASVTDVLGKGQKHCYRIMALAKQVLALDLETKDNKLAFDVYTPSQGRIADAEQSWKQRMRTSGDKIIVVQGGVKEAKYTLTVDFR